MWKDDRIATGDEMTDGKPDAFENEPHWFSGREQELQIFKINRRPFSSEMLNVYSPPDDLFVHLQEVFEKPHQTRSGRKIQRDWRVGNLIFDREKREISGRIGWTRTTESLENSWDEESHSFLEHVQEQSASAVTPFAILADSEFVGILRHPSFSTDGIVNVMLENLLNAGEMDREAQTVIWNVDPIGDKAKFDEWFQSMDQVLSLTVVVKRPNPDAAPEFEEIIRRLEVLDAESIKETTTARDANVGINKDAVRHDKTLNGFMAAAMRSYGYIKGIGRKDGRKKKFNQLKTHLLEEPISDVGGEWQTANDSVLAALRKVRSRRN